MNQCVIQIAQINRTFNTCITNNKYGYCNYLIAAMSMSIIVQYCFNFYLLSFVSLYTPSSNIVFGNHLNSCKLACAR